MGQPAHGWLAWAGARWRAPCTVACMPGFLLREAGSQLPWLLPTCSAAATVIVLAKTASRKKRERPQTPATNMMPQNTSRRTETTKPTWAGGRTRGAGRGMMVVLHECACAL